MILVEAILLGLVLSLLTGGSISRLKDEKLQGETLLLFLLPVQVLWPGIVQRLGLPCNLSIVIWLLMMGALAFLLFLNAPRRWMLAFAGLGIAMNVLVIGVNGAMPVSLKAASEIGATRAEARAVMEDSCLHEALDEDTKLVFLADVIATPGPSWQRGVISIGDIFLAVGLGAWVFAGSRFQR